MVNENTDALDEYIKYMFTVLICLLCILFMLLVFVCSVSAAFKLKHHVYHLDAALTSCLK